MNITAEKAVPRNRDEKEIKGYCFCFDMIHPFIDGNGRMSRLLTLLLLYRCGYFVGKYISLELMSEKTKDSYEE